MGVYSITKEGDGWVFTILQRKVMGGCLQNHKERKMMGGCLQYHKGRKMMGGCLHCHEEK